MYWSSWKRMVRRRPFSSRPGVTPGVSDGAEVDGVELSELVDLSFRDHLSGGEIAVAAVVEVGPLVADVLEWGDCLQDLESFVGDFGAGSVAWDYRDF